jgi:hypothetical protein
MYFLDPDSGRRRRALARDKYLHGKTALQDATESAVHLAADQTRGAIARIQNRIASRPEGTVDLPVEDPTSGSCRARPRQRFGHGARSRNLIPLQGSARDYDGLVERIGDRRVVLIGEASHGTEDFYRERAVITRRSSSRRDSAPSAAEADWPDAYRVNRYVRGEGRDVSADAALPGSGASRRGCGATTWSSTS